MLVATFMYVIDGRTALSGSEFLSQSGLWFSMLAHESRVVPVPWKIIQSRGYIYIPKNPTPSLGHAKIDRLNDRGSDVENHRSLLIHPKAIRLPRLERK
jgi:hypothetical protein